MNECLSNTTDTRGVGIQFRSDITTPCHETNSVDVNDDDSDRDDNDDDDDDRGEDIGEGDDDDADDNEKDREGVAERTIGVDG